jgi:YidC/Oxa1 family membrane protein insertase
LSLIFGAGFFGIEHFTPPWDVIFLPLFNLLVLSYEVLFSDFALGIIVFTIVIRTILAPLFVKQIRSSKEMQRMQPLIREVQRKHKGNRQKVSEETMALYREHGVNPAAGCLPLVLQLPILLALYQAMIRASNVWRGGIGDDQQAAFQALESANVVTPLGGDAYRVAVDGACNLDAYNQLPQFLPLNCQLIDPIKLPPQGVDTTIGWLFNLDLAQIDNVFAIPIGGEGGFAISAIAAVAAILQFVQVKMTSPRPNPEDPTASMTTTMVYMFPILTIVWGGLFPSGLILYWVVYTAYLTVHQYFIMGWGNLFPLFGWQPSWAPSPDAAPAKAPPARLAQEADAEKSDRSTSPRPQGGGTRGGSKPRGQGRRGGAKRRGRRR